MLGKLLGSAREEYVWCGAVRGVALGTPPGAGATVTKTNKQTCTQFGIWKFLNLREKLTSILNRYTEPQKRVSTHNRLFLVIALAPPSDPLLFNA